MTRELRTNEIRNNDNMKHHKVAQDGIFFLYTYTECITKMLCYNIINFTYIFKSYRIYSHSVYYTFDIIANAYIYNDIRLYLGTLNKFP